ncbi:MAG: FKBP-type peptidyl-prolyl cis-trans isomerase [Armatimonadetes bacterium]|nr:FKBP-type peptidyl-prolyl cis-trans isomerase [Armatimonadota bacterium]
MHLLGLGVALLLVGCNSESSSDEPKAIKTTEATKDPTPADFEKAEKALVKEDVKVGTGNETVENGDMVWVLYTGTLKEGGKEFDSNTAPEKDPFSFVVGQAAVIKGWDLGIVGMKKGGERKLTIPALLAYGSKGQDPIPPNADLNFDVKLLEIVKKGREAEYWKDMMKNGSGEPAKVGDTVTVHYTGTQLNGKKFDSSRDRNEPFSFKLGEGGVIKAWDAGLVGAKKGDRFMLHAPPEVAYGPGGRNPIPPNAFLLFDIEVLDIKRK